MVESAMVLRVRDGEDPVVFTCTPMRRTLYVCNCGVLFFFSSLQVLLWQCEGCGLRVGGWGERRASETGSTSTGAQEEWPLRQTLIRQRAIAEYEWIHIALPQVTVDNLIVLLIEWSGTDDNCILSLKINSTIWYSKWKFKLKWTVKNVSA